MKIVLSQTAPWNDKLINGYRTRYTTAGGRYFKVSADFLYTPWHIEEIAEDGTSMWQNFSGICLTLAQARTIIAQEAGEAE